MAPPLTPPSTRRENFIRRLKKMSAGELCALFISTLILLTAFASLAYCVIKKIKEDRETPIDDTFLMPPKLDEWKEVRYGIDSTDFVIWLSPKHRLAARFSYRPKIAVQTWDRTDFNFALDQKDEVAKYQQTSADSYPRYCSSPACGSPSCKGVCQDQCKGKSSGSSWNQLKGTKRITLTSFEESCDEKGRNEYQRGHLVPASHMTQNQELYSLSFFMTNISPMTKSLNTGPWKETEGLTKAWAKDVHVFGGAVWEIRDPRVSWFRASHTIDTPKAYWKIIIAREGGALDRCLKGSSKDFPRQLAFWMPNIEDLDSMDKYVLSVSDLEKKLLEHDQATSFDFTMKESCYRTHGKCTTWPYPSDCKK